jgi:hypothetical protein
MQQRHADIGTEKNVAVAGQDIGGDILMMDVTHGSERKFSVSKTTRGAG